MTKNFQRSEFTCQCGCGFDAISSVLVDALQELREVVGKAITVTSGCRCAAHNVKVGGAKKSVHILGTAADIKVPGMRVRELYRHVADIPAFRGVGVSDEGGFLHVDVRKVPAKWCYRKGRQCRWFDVR